MKLYVKMKTILKFISPIIIAFLAASINDVFAYSISTKDHVITVKMNHPSVGIVGLNAVGWSDDPDDIGREIYESFVGFFDSRKKGTYTVEVYWKVKDSYGKDKLDYAGSYTFLAEEMSKYESYYYSKNYKNVPDILFEMAFPNGIGGSKQSSSRMSISSTKTSTSNQSTSNTNTQSKPNSRLYIKENDYLVGKILNPTCGAAAFKRADMSTENTQFLSKEDYLTSSYIQKNFSYNGKFNEEEFNRFYNLVADEWYRFCNWSYNRCAELEVVYDSNDMYRPSNVKVVYCHGCTFWKIIR